MAVKIGHAVFDENGKAKGGLAGDQTRKELMIQDWYKREWTAVFRAKDNKIAEKIAYTMEQACMNNNIGYDQGQRTTLYEQARNLNWDISKIAEKCECDCSSLVSVCVNSAGIEVSKDMYTGNQKDVLYKTGKFEVLTENKYLTGPDYLRRGDILLGPGHTAIIVSGDTPKLTVDAAKSFSKTLAGAYKVSASRLNIRYGAGIDKEILTTINKETEIRCYGYYTKVSGTNWLFVQLKRDGITYYGYVSSKYIIKKK